MTDESGDDRPGADGDAPDDDPSDGDPSSADGDGAGPAEPDDDVDDAALADSGEGANPADSGDGAADPEDDAAGDGDVPRDGDDAPAERETDLVGDPPGDVGEPGAPDDRYLDEDDPNATRPADDDPANPDAGVGGEASAAGAGAGAAESDGGEASGARRASSNERSEFDGGYGGDPFEDHAEYEIDEPAVEGAPEDEEMPLADHIEEMVKRLGVVVVVMAVISGIVFPFADRLINFFWYSYLPGTFEQCGQLIQVGQTGTEAGAACPRVYHPLALVLARLKVASLAGFVIALPVFVYETYLFMRPGLYPHERRYYLASVPTSLVLAAIGVAFAHLLVLPAIFTYFVYYSQGPTTIAFGLAETFDLMVLMMGGFAFVFQIPLFIMLALMMGLVTRRWMVQRRLLFWGAFAGLAFLFSPDPTGMAPFIVAATMIGLFEGTLLLAKWTGR